MKPPPVRYNPAQDGISAKIWECLRNNLEFSRLIELTRSNDKESREFVVKQCSKLWDGPLAQLALVLFAVPRNLGRLEERIWPELPDDLHEAIDSAASCHPLSPLLVESPYKNLLGNSSSERARRRRVRAIVDLRDLWNQYTVLAIPKFIRDSGHRGDIITAIEKMVPPAKVSKIKLRDSLRNGGKLLGTEKDWEVWSFIEHFKSRVPRPSAARTLAAVWLYDPKAFDEAETESYFLTGPGRKDAEDLYVQREEKIDNHLSPIESGIRNVYPAFSIFQ